MAESVNKFQFPSGWKRAHWLLVVGGVLLSVLCYVAFLSSQVDGDIKSKIEAHAIAAETPIAPILSGAEKRVDLANDMAQFIVLPISAQPDEAITQFHLGKGVPFGALEALGSAAGGGDPVSVFVWFAYRTAGQDPILLRYRSLSQLLTAVWIENTSATSYELISLAGPDAPRYLNQHPSLYTKAPPLLPSISLPASPDRLRRVLVRVDSIYPVWSSFTLYTRYGYEHQRSTGGYLDGVFLGAVLVAMGFALYGLYRRLAIDYLTFLLAAAAMCFWYLVRREHMFGTDFVLIRRFALTGPIFLYFLLHGIGLKRLLYPPMESIRNSTWVWRQAPLWLAFGYLGAGLIGTAFYAGFGIHTPGIALIDGLNEWLFVVAPVLLLLATLLAPNRQLSGYRLLLAAEIAGTMGSGLQFIHANFPWLDGDLTEILIQYPLPIEVLIWAAALSSRFYYLEMVAKRRVKSALRREAARVRTVMQANVESREQALAALDNSYQALDNVRSTMLGIIDTHAHAAQGLMMRLGGHLEGLRQNGAPDTADRITAATAVLTQLEAAVKDAEHAVRDSQSSQHALAPASALITWQVESIRNSLEARGLTITLVIEKSCGGNLVDGYHFMEAARELLSNVSRYALSDTDVSVTLKSIEGQIELSVKNKGVLRADDKELRFGWPITPASTTFNGDTSSGRGLATLRTLLSGIGATVRYQSEPPDDILVTAVFLCRVGVDAAALHK